MKFSEGTKYFRWADGELDDTSFTVWVVVTLPDELAAPLGMPQPYGSRWPTDAQTAYVERYLDRQGVALIHPAPSRQPGSFFASPPNHEVVGQRYLITQRAGYDV